MPTRKQLGGQSILCAAFKCLSQAENYFVRCSECKLKVKCKVRMEPNSDKLEQAEVCIVALKMDFQ